MNLWQIRHIPNSWQKLISLTISSAFLLGFDGFGDPEIPKAFGQSESTAAKPAVPNEPNPTAATEFVKNVHQSLYSHSSISADLEQTVTIGNQQFNAAGRYVSSGQKLRLEYTIKPDQGVSGGLLEICDGRDLWSLVNVLDNKRVTHRDVQQIKAAISETRNVTDAVLTAELGLGGLAGLIASLERTMSFEAMKTEMGDDGSTTIVQGRWKPEYQKNWPRGKDDSLPIFVPDVVRITADSQTLFPTRIVYAKKVVEKDKKVFRPMVSLKFHNVEFDKPIADQEFAFEPPERVVPEDITRQYLDRIKQSAEAAAANADKKPVDSSGK